MSFSFQSKGGRLSNQPMSEINVTPLVDVMLVLLVIFMVTAPMMVQGLDVKLPEAKAKELVGASEKLVLTLKYDKTAKLGGVDVAFKDLPELLKHNAKLQEEKELLIDADGRLPHEIIVQVMSWANEAGAQNIGIMTTPEGAHG